MVRRTEAGPTRVSRFSAEEQVLVELARDDRLAFDRKMEVLPEEFKKFLFVRILEGKGFADIGGQFQVAASRARTVVRLAIARFNELK
jgi:DNA-directed RNA polymerase specialized sigma24 family protein